MGVTDIADDILRFAEETRDAAAEMLFEPRLRLGVTGLSRAGKTVFITSLIANLRERGRLTQLSAEADGRFQAVTIQPHPDRETPRFDYETHLASLSGANPVWPESTRRISQVRLSLKFQSNKMLSSFTGPGVLHLDIVDYPGEWLLDLALLDLSYADWSAKALAKADKRSEQSAPWQDLITARETDAEFDESVAKPLAAAFTDYLNACRVAGMSGLAPGRFLMPGDLEGSPALTFCLLPPGRDPLHSEFEKRFEAYKRSIVKPFFRDHFATLDRQVVLVDLMTALNDGLAAVADLGGALSEILEAFRPGQNSWLSSILGRKIDRILFAATKADHIHSNEHDRLTAIMTSLLRDSVSRASFKGAETDALAIAFLRTTSEQITQQNGREVRAVRGKLLDDGREVALDPGGLPDDPASVLAAARGADATASWLDGDNYQVMRFAPPVLKNGEGLPHIRLDRALEFLIGDRLT